MQNLEKRVSDLELANDSNEGKVILIHLVGKGEVDKEIQRITHGKQEWQRQPDESKQDLKDRAQREVTPTTKGVPMFFCFR